MLVFLFDVKGSVSSTHTSTHGQQEAYYGLLKQVSECAVRSVGRSLQIVKSTGDGYYIVGPEPEACLQLFVELNHVARQFLFKDKAIEIRCGAHFGAITLVSEPPADLQGDGANVAARCCSNADAGELVVTSTLFDLIRNNSLLQLLHLDLEDVERPKAKGCEDVQMRRIKPTKEKVVVPNAVVPNVGEHSNPAETRLIDLGIPITATESNIRLRLGGYSLLGARGEQGILYAWSFGKTNGHPIESAAFNQRVAINPTESDKTTSSYTTSISAGCILQPSGLSCRFCHTGRLPFKGNMTPAEIALQNVFMVITDMTCTNFEAVRSHSREFAYMGHGEPGLAYLQVREAIRITDDSMAMLRQPIRRHLISTCGVPEMIDSLAKDIASKFFRSRVTLHFSMHAENGRKELMPIDSIYPYASVIRSLSAFYDATGEKPSVAVLLFDHFKPKGGRRTFTMDERQFSGILNTLDPMKHRISLCVPNITNTIGKDQGVSAVTSKRFLAMASEKGFEAKEFASFGIRENAGCGMLHGRQPAKSASDLRHNVQRATAIIQQVMVG